MTDTSLLTLSCPTTHGDKCPYWKPKTQGCGFFVVADEPDDEDCKAAQRLAWKLETSDD